MEKEQGILTIHKLDPDYFIIGEAYRINPKGNDFRNAILVDREDDSVTFMIYDHKSETGISEYIISMEDLMYRGIGITRLKRDYDKVFKYKNG